MKSLPWVLLICLLLILSIVTLASKKRVVEDKDPNFNIVEKESSGNKTIYTATQKGYGGNIEAVVVVENDKVVSFDVVSNNETKDKYKLVIDADYIDKLIKNQDNLKDVDTVSGATVTSTALKKLITNVMDDYN